MIDMRVIKMIDMRVIEGTCILRRYFQKRLVGRRLLRIIFGSICIRRFGSRFTKDKFSGLMILHAIQFNTDDYR